MEWIAFILMTLITGVCVFVIVNLLNKLEEAEDIITENEEYVIDMQEWINTFTVRVNEAYEKMKEADRRGSFESDDEVGSTFKTLKDIIEELNTTINQNDNDTK